MKSIRAFAQLLVLAIIVILGGAGYFTVKSGVFNKDMQRAKVEVKTTAALVDATNAQLGQGAAVLTTIGEANATAPDSKERDFIGRAVPIGLGVLGAPNQQFLFQMEQLKNATLTGQLKQADRINSDLTQEAGVARAIAARALVAKQAADNNSLVAAKAEAAANADKLLMFYALLAVAALYIYTKVTHFSPGQISTYVTDLRQQGVADVNQAIAKLDVVARPWQQKMVSWLNRWKAM